MIWKAEKKNRKRRKSEIGKESCDWELLSHKEGRH